MSWFSELSQDLVFVQLLKSVLREATGRLIVKLKNVSYFLSNN